MSTTTERLELLITSSSRGAVSGISETRGEVGKLDDQVRGSTGLLQKFGLQGESTGAMIKAGLVGGALAAGAAITKFALDGVDSFVNLAGEVRDFGQKSGASAEESSKMVAVLDDFGIKAQSGADAMLKLGINSGEGGVKLAEFGVEVAKNKDGTTDLVGTLLNVADAYKETEDPGKRAELVMAAFGKSGKDLIPILEQGRDGLREFFASAENNHQILSQEDLDKAREYELAIDSLNDAVQGLQRSAGEALIPTLTQVTNLAAGTITGLDSATGSVGGLDGAVRGLAGNLPITGTLIHGLGAGSELMAGHFRNAAEEGVRSFGFIGSGAAKLGETLGIFDKGGQDTDKFTDSQKRLQAAQQDVARVFADTTSTAREKHVAQRELNAAENEYEGVVGRVSKALGDNTSKILENMAAGQEYINGQRGVEGAQLNVEAATKRYNDTLAENGAEALETRQAAFALEGQYVNLGQATFDAAILAGDSQKEAAQKQVDALSYVAGTLDPGSPLRVFLEGYIDKLRNGIPDAKNTTVTADTSQADAALDGVLNKLGRISSNAWGTALGSIGSGIAGVRATGGPVEAGSMYLVNEHTPNSELFVPAVSGHIYPAGSAPTAAGTSFALYGDFVFPNVRSAADADGIFRVLRRMAEGN